MCCGRKFLSQHIFFDFFEQNKKVFLHKLSGILTLKKEGNLGIKKDVSLSVLMVFAQINQQGQVQPVAGFCLFIDGCQMGFDSPFRYIEISRNLQV